jgi:hypothetical protein
MARKTVTRDDEQDDRLPTEVEKHDWIYATYPNRPEGASHYSGKWLLFLEGARVNQAWIKVADTTRKGELGPAAKSQHAEELIRFTYVAFTLAIVETSEI